MIQRKADELLAEAERATQTGHAPAAIELYREVLVQDQGNSTVRNHLACLLLAEGEVDEAVDLLEETATPHTHELRKTLGYALFRRGDYHRSERILRELLEEAPEDSTTRNHLGLVLIRRGRGREALEPLHRVVRENPFFVEAWNNLGCAYRSLGAFDRARAAFREAIHVDPYNVDAHNNLGCVLRDSGRAEEAVDELKLAVHLEPGNAAIHRNLALSFSRSGDPERALRHLRQHLRTNRFGEEVAEVHRLFRELEDAARKKRRASTQARDQEEESES